MSTKQFYSILLIGIVCLGFTGLAKGYEMNTYDVVDDNSTDLDSYADRGTENNFAYCQDQHPDSDYMTIQESDYGTTGVSENLAVNGFTSTWVAWTENGVSPYLSASDGTNNIFITAGDLSDEGWFTLADTTATGSDLQVTLYIEFDSSGGEVCNWYIDTTGDNTQEFSGSIANGGSAGTKNSGVISGLDTATEVTNARVWLEYDYTGGSDDMQIDYVYIYVYRLGGTNYNIDFEYQFTSCITTRMVANVCFYVYSHTGSETLNIQYRNGGSWSSLTTITTTGWKNVSITATSTYTIRCYGATETGDASQDTWTIDVLEIWTYDKLTIVNNTVDVTGYYEVRGDQSTGWTIYLNYTGAGGGSCDLTVHNNTDHTTGKYETSFTDGVGWDIWLNYTGELPVFNHYENILHATGSHDHNTENDGYTINSWANYSGSAPTFNEYENIVNATGTHENNFDATNWIYNVWANYTGDTTPITLYENLINGATGTHEYNLAIGGYNVWANYSGTGGGCSGIVWVNYTDNNLTFNVSVDKATNDNTSTYEINEDDWLFMSGFSLENGELGLFLIFALFSLAFIVDKESEKKSIWKPILLFMDTPISLATGLYYLGLGATFSVAWWVGVCLFVFAVLLAFGGLYYGLSFGRSSKK